VELSASAGSDAKAAPKVFLDYTQDELDRAYDQQVWASNFKELRKESFARCEELRRRMRHFEVSYGPSPEETLEILPTARQGAPVHLFIHGGRWAYQPDTAFIWYADTMVDAGAHFVAARFTTLDPEGKGPERMADMVAQLRRAILWLRDNARSFGGDPEQIHVMGCSSGGHLTSAMLATDWAGLGCDRYPIKSGFCISGMYELHPVLLSWRSNYVKLTEAEKDAFSAMRHLDRIECPVLVAWGSRESPEFKRQGGEFAAALRARKTPCSELLLEGCNHFEGVRTLMESTSPLAQAVFRQMGLVA
jgi:arylformamidase